MKRGQFALEIAHEALEALDPDVSDADRRVALGVLTAVLPLLDRGTVGRMAPDVLRIAQLAPPMSALQLREALQPVLNELPDAAAVLDEITAHWERERKARFERAREAQGPARE